MKLARLGNFGSEKPAIIINDLEAVFVDDVVSDFNRDSLSNGALDKLKKLDFTNRPKVKILDIYMWRNFINLKMILLKNKTKFWNII